MAPKEESKSESISDEPVINDLVIYIEQARKKIRPVADSSEEPLLALTPQEIEPIAAAKSIQRFWRGYKVKEKLIQSPYFSYLSMYDQDDEKRALSSLMFGRHIAEVHSEEKIPNPYIQRDSHYHRCDKLDGEILHMLLDEFEIPLDNNKDYFYVPLSNLNLTSLEDILNDFLPETKDKIRMIQDDKHSIVLAEIPRKGFDSVSWFKHPTWIFKALGIVATPWEISSNLMQVSKVEVDVEAVVIEERFPKSKAALFDSEILRKTQKIASSSDYPTQKLAQSIINLLTEMEGLSSDAIQRIALILDLSNKFYAHHYPRYAFCVYTILHEMSLAFSEKQDQEYLKNMFDHFLSESSQTLLNSLALSTVNDHTLFSTPALSGTHAHAIVLRLLNALGKKSGQHLSIETIGPSYFEFDYIRAQRATHEEADVYAITTGPVVTPEGLIPGTDINKFIKQYIIDKNREKPTVIMVDTTTTLYKNLRLDEHSQQLVQSGQLSIIVIESHQKFGMIHADQAQYGRVMSICSNQFFDKDILAEFEEKAYLDFCKQLDMRIGAFISTSCSDVLECIKQQHFTNGMLLRNILTQSILATAHVISHDVMLKNLDELYFVTLPDKESGFDIYLKEEEGKTDYYLWDGENFSYISTEGIKEIIPIINKVQFLNDIEKVAFDDMGRAHLSMTQMSGLLFCNSTYRLPPNVLEAAIEKLIYRRDSFGHYQTSMVSFGQVRVSPNASDSIDCLIQAAQIYLAHHYRKQPDKLLEDFLAIKLDDMLSVEEQISLIAIMNTTKLYPMSGMNKEKYENLFVKMNATISNCQNLKNRQAMREVEVYYQQLREIVLTGVSPDKRKMYLESLLEKNDLSLKIKKLKM